MDSPCLDAITVIILILTIASVITNALLIIDRYQLRGVVQHQRRLLALRSPIATLEYKTDDDTNDDINVTH